LSRYFTAICMILELLLRLVIVPQWRACLLRMLGSQVGRNVRIYEIRLFNLSDGFRNLVIEDNVHVGTGCLFDLKGLLTIRRGTTISPGVTVITHNDPGQYHDSPICSEFEPGAKGVEIGPDCWIGTNSTILAGSQIGGKTVIGAGSLVRGHMEGKAIYAGVPARKVRDLMIG